MKTKLEKLVFCYNSKDKEVLRFLNRELFQTVSKYNYDNPSNVRLIYQESENGFGKLIKFHSYDEYYRYRYSSLIKLNISHLTPEEVIEVYKMNKKELQEKFVEYLV